MWGCVHVGGSGEGQGLYLRCFYKSDVTLLLETLRGFLLLLLQNADSFPWLTGPGPAALPPMAASPDSLLCGYVGRSPSPETHRASHLPIPWDGPPVFPRGWLLLLFLVSQDHRIESGQPHTHPCPVSMVAVLIAPSARMRAPQGRLSAGFIHCIPITMKSAW